MLLSDSVKRRLSEAALSAAPHEAVGIIVDEQHVVVLPNTSTNPETGFVLEKSHIREALSGYDAEAIIIWHSHPSGGVGPSRLDMKNRVPGVGHLVVTIDGKGPIFTWY